MTFFLNPFAGSTGSRCNLPSAGNNSSTPSIAGTHQSVMPITTFHGQLGAGDPAEMSTGVHEIEQSLATKADRTGLQEARDSNSDVPLAPSTRARIASLVQTAVPSTGSVPHGRDVLPRSFQEFEDTEDYLMTLNPLDLLLGVLSPRATDASPRVFTKSHEEKSISDEWGLGAGIGDTSASLLSAGHEGGGAKGFELSTKMSSVGDDESPISILAHVQDPETLRRVPAHVKETSTLNLAKFKPITVLAQKLKLSLGDTLGDRLLEKFKDARTPVGYQKSGHGNLDQDKLEEVVKLQQESSGRSGKQPGNRALSTGTSAPSTHEERYDGAPAARRSWGASQHEFCVSLSSLPIDQLERNSNEDERLLNLRRQATAPVQGSGISEAEVEDTRDGQSRYLHHNPITLKQSSDQRLHSTSAGTSPVRMRKVAFPEIVAMGPPPSHAPWPRVGRGGSYHLPAASLQSPHVHRFPVLRGRSTSAAGAPAENDDSDQQKMFKRLVPGSHRSSRDGLAESALETKSVTRRDLAHDKLVDRYTPDKSGVQEAVAKNNPSSAPSPTASLPQGASRRRQISSKPLDEAQAESEGHTRIRSYFERNRLTATQLMSNTEQFKPRSEQAAALSIMPMKASAHGTQLIMEDAFLAAVSKTGAAKRSKPTTNANEQLAGGSTEESYGPSSKKQRAVLTIKPGGEHVKLASECQSDVPPSAAKTPAAASLDQTLSQPVVSAKATNQGDLEDDNERDIRGGVQECWEDLDLVVAHGHLQDEHVNQRCTQTSLDNDDDDILFHYCTM